MVAAPQAGAPPSELLDPLRPFAPWGGIDPERPHLAEHAGENLAGIYGGERPRAGRTAWSQATRSAQAVHAAARRASRCAVRAVRDYLQSPEDERSR